MRGYLIAAMALLLLALALPTIGFGQARRSSTSSSNVNYIDTAIVGSMLRFRFDAAFDNNVPDRAEFFYGKCGCFKELGLDPDAPGPPQLESNVDYQLFEFRCEEILAPRLSVFLEMPVRSIDPEQNENAVGVGDLQAGFKYALSASDDRAVTFQFRSYFPTGETERGLGTGHFSLEPALLVFHQLDLWSFELEFRDWIPVGGSSAAGTGIVGEDSFAGNVVRYGIGIGYDVVHECTWRLTPVVEFVGWSVLGGISSFSPDGTLDNLRIEKAAGTTIVNAKVGLRLTDDQLGSFSVSYGQALTDQVWYENVLRLEYRMSY